MGEWKIPTYCMKLVEVRGLSLVLNQLKKTAKELRSVTTEQHDFLHRNGHCTATPSPRSYTSLLAHSIFQHGEESLKHEKAANRMGTENGGSMPTAMSWTTSISPQANKDTFKRTSGGIHEPPSYSLCQEESTIHIGGMARR